MHLGTEMILDLIEGRIENKHAKDCPECIQRIEAWRSLHSRLRQETQLLNAPSAVLDEACEIVKPRSRVREILATMTFDSFTQPAFAGARAGAASCRQVVFHAEECDIHVKVSGDSEHRRITGQVMARAKGADIEKVTVHLLHCGARIRSTVVDPLGEFEFENTPDDMLGLQIDLPNLTIISALSTKEKA